MKIQGKHNSIKKTFNSCGQIISGTIRVILLICICTTGNVKFFVASATTFDEPQTQKVLVISGHPDDKTAPTINSLPFKEAISKLRSLCKQYPGRQKILQLSSGIYHLDSTLVFDDSFSGTKDGPVVICGPKSRNAIITGLKSINGWKPYDDHRWSVRLPGQIPLPNQFFVNGQFRSMAREPDDTYFYAEESFEPTKKDNDTAKAQFYAAPGIFSRAKDPYLVALHSWTVSRHRIKNINPDNGLIQLTSKSQFPFNTWDYKMAFWLEGYVNAVTKPGEWAIDQDEGILVYYPYPDENMKSVVTEIPVIDRLITLHGTPGAKAKLHHFSINGLQFCGTNWLLERDNSADGQNHRSIESPGIFLFGVHDVAITKCSFTGMGGYALWADRACENIRISGNDFRFNAAGAIRIGSDILPEDEKLVCHEIIIENNLIERNGLVFRGSSGIWVSYAHHLSIAHNEIAYQPYTGISIGWGWGQGGGLQGTYSNTVCYNYIHHIGDGLMSDMGGIYTLTESPGTQVYGNVIHDIKARMYSGFGLYADAASADIIFRDNLIFNTSSAGVFRNYGLRLVFQNNIVANSLQEPGLISIGRKISSAPWDKSWLHTHHNVFYSSIGKDMIAPGRFDQGPVTFANNIYWSTAGSPLFDFVRPAKKNMTGRIPVAWESGLSLERWQRAGFDEGSKVCDPYGPKGPGPDFRLPDNSPARAAGCGSDEFLMAGLLNRPFYKFRRDDPYIPAWPLLQVQPTIIRDDFEKTDQQILPKGMYLRNTAIEDFKIITDKDREGHILEWNINPRQKTINCEPGIPVGQMVLKFDFKLQEKAIFNLTIKNRRLGQISEIFKLEISEEGQYSINNRPVVFTKKDVWHTLKLQCDSADKKQWLVSLYDSSGLVLKQVSVPYYISKDMPIHLSLLGSVKGASSAIFLDNLYVGTISK